MRIAWLGSVTVALALAGSTGGCAFFGKADPVIVRYFTPERADGRPEGAAPAKAMLPTTLELRLGRVTSASYLKDRIAFRDESFEIGYYERLRWTEKPEDYLRRALGRALFEDQGIRQIISGAGPTLDVDLGAFEELRSPRHAARITVTWVLHDDRHVQFQQTFTIERPIASTDAAIAPAMAEAFEEAVQRVVADATTALSKSPSVTAAAP